MKRSCRDLSINVAVGRFILKNNQITVPSPRFTSYLKQVWYWDYLKQYFFLLCNFSGYIFLNSCNEKLNLIGNCS